MLPEVAHAAQVGGRDGHKEMVDDLVDLGNTRKAKPLRIAAACRCPRASICSPLPAAPRPPAPHRASKQPTWKPLSLSPRSSAWNVRYVARKPRQQRYSWISSSMLCTLDAMAQPRRPAGHWSRKKKNKTKQTKKKKERKRKKKKKNRAQHQQSVRHVVRRNEESLKCSRMTFMLLFSSFR